MEVSLLDALAMVSLGVRQAKEPLLEEGTEETAALVSPWFLCDDRPALS